MNVHIYIIKGHEYKMVVMLAVHVYDAVEADGYSQTILHHKGRIVGKVVCGNDIKIACTNSWKDAPADKAGHDQGFSYQVLSK